MSESISLSASEVYREDSWIRPAKADRADLGEFIYGPKEATCQWRSDMPNKRRYDRPPQGQRQRMKNLTAQGEQRRQKLLVISKDMQAKKATIRDTRKRKAVTKSKPLPKKRSRSTRPARPTKRRKDSASEMDEDEEDDEDDDDWMNDEKDVESEKENRPTGEEEEEENYLE